MHNDIKISQKDINIFLFEHDNALNVRGQTADGFINEVILKDDPEAAAKAKQKLQAVRDYHQDALDQAQDQLDEQFPALESRVDEVLADEEENGEE